MLTVAAAAIAGAAWLAIKWMSRAAAATAVVYSIIELCIRVAI